MNDTAPAADSKEQRAFWVQQVNANMGIEGMPPDEFTKDLQRRYIEGEIEVEDIVKETKAAFLAEQNMEK